jgi:ribonuclease R
MIKKVLSLLSQHKEGMSLARIARELHLASEEKALLRKRMNQLESQGVILKLRKKYFLFPRTNIVQGRFTASPRGFGFVIPEEEHLEDIFVPARFSGGACHGDTVEVSFKDRGKKGKPEGRVIRILSREKQSLLGLCHVRSGQVFFLPFGAPSAQEVPISWSGSPSPRSGDVVKVNRDSLTLEEILGPIDSPGVDTKVIIERYNLEISFSKEALEEADIISSTISSEQRKNRIDHTDWLTITIDGEDAQDFDDAVSIQLSATGHYLLGVHIADVSHFVRPGTALDREAYRRGTSVYFPDLTLPMLPEKLSNHVCSLRPQEEKVTVSVVMEINSEGEVLHVDFYPSLIRTVERMTYGSVFRILRGDEVERKKYASLVPDLLNMRDLAKMLRQKRIREGSIDFDLTEPELVYREGNLSSIIPFESNEAHHIIEEFMVVANESVAAFLASKGIPSLYRVHPQPSPVDLDGLRKLLEHFNIYLPKPQKITRKDLQQVLEQAKKKPEEKFIILQVLKSLRLAAYSDENIGHYGLAKKEYTHFTSPIRRYPDLIVHRILRHILGQDKIKIEGLSSLSKFCSQKERSAEEAEKDLVEWRIFRFLKGKLGEEFEGLIVDITRAGLVVELDGYFVDGLVSYGDLGGDYFYKKSERTLVGRRSGKAFELGSKVRIILVSVDPNLRRMNLILAP